MGHATNKKTPSPPLVPRDSDTPEGFDPLSFTQRLMEKLGESAPLIQDILERQAKNTAQGKPIPGTTLDPMNIRHAVTDFWGHMLRHPEQMAELQLKYWQTVARIWQESARKFFGEHSETVVEAEKGDRRFRDPVWNESAIFDFIKQTYLLTCETVESALAQAHDMPSNQRHKLSFYTRQMMQAVSPSNFAMTNPEVLRETLRTGGDNLIRGLQNLLEDLQRGDGLLKISTTAPHAFHLGKNLATTKGKVVWQNRMCQLIQYSPSTEKTHEIPLLIVPPWINKYYILDLRPDNSFVKWAVDQGLTVFLISWVNPDKSYADTDFDDYALQGILPALEVIEKITRQKTANLIGYCIGGTLTAMLLSVLAERGQDKRIASATFFTTLLDFESPGDMKVFIDEEQLETLEQHMAHQGYLEADALQKTFAILRANDMIWSFVVNNYMMGRDPFPFDLLYWNEDSTNLPAKMHGNYLRRMYLKNEVIQPGKYKMDGTPVDLRKIKTPCYFLSTREDHIAPWQATWSGAKMIAEKARVTFVLAASGHVAGVVNPPNSSKYGYWTASEEPGRQAPDKWLKSATYTEGSWWPHWGRWVKARSGPMVRALTPGMGPFKGLEDAPGSYVKKQV